MKDHLHNADLDKGLPILHQTCGNRIDHSGSKSFFSEAGNYLKPSATKCDTVNPGCHSNPGMFGGAPGHGLAGWSGYESLPESAAVLAGKTTTHLLAEERVMSFLHTSLYWWSLVSLVAFSLTVKELRCCRS